MTGARRLSGPPSCLDGRLDEIPWPPGLLFKITNGSDYLR
jgi:hypothetical protein